MERQSNAPTTPTQPKKDGALIRKIERLSGEKPPRKKRAVSTLGLLGKLILELTPENRVKTAAFVLQLLTEQEDDNAMC